VGFIVAGLGCLAWWQWSRRGVDAQQRRALGDATWLLGRAARVDVPLWTDQALICALLASEAAGHLQVARVIEDGAEVVRVRALAGGEGRGENGAGRGVHIHILRNPHTNVKRLCAVSCGRALGCGISHQISRSVW
jgi:hypothetical protein